MDERRIPIFPLPEIVFFPETVLPLHVFEPRYRALTRDCLAGDREFGVVLIARGSEVGGGDERTDVGTVARIAAAAELPDGRWYLQTVGTRRIRVDAWLPDDPYPMAEVSAFDEATGGDAAGLVSLVESVERALRRTCALRSELGDSTALVTFDLAADPVLASYQAAVLAGLGPVDAQLVLSEPSAAGRFAHLDRLLAEQAELLEFRLTGG